MIESLKKIVSRQASGPDANAARAALAALGVKLDGPPPLDEIVKELERVAADPSDPHNAEARRMLAALGDDASPERRRQREELRARMGLSSPTLGTRREGNSLVLGVPVRGSR